MIEAINYTDYLLIKQLIVEVSREINKQNYNFWESPLFVSVTSILTALLGVFGLLWQSHRNNISAINLQKENLRHEIKREIHVEIEEALSEASDSEIKASGVFHRINFQYTSDISFLKEGLKPTGFNVTINDFNDIHYSSRSSFIKLIGLIEKYEIVQPEITIFKDAISSSLHDISESFSPLSNEAFRLLPQFVKKDSFGNTEPVVIPKPFPDEIQMKKFKQLSEPYINALGDMGCYIFDFRVEIQNLLLGSLFEHRVPKRKPINPSLKIISTDPDEIESLRRYFREETHWGKHVQEVNEQVRKSYSNEKLEV